MERDALSPEQMVYSFIYICRRPQLNGGKHTVTVHGATHRRKVYVQWGGPGSPRGLL